MNNLQTSKGFMSNLTPSATLALTAKAKAMKAAGEDILNLCAGEPDFDTPEHIKQAAINALKNGDTKYTPESGKLELRKAIAEKLRVENHIECLPEQIVVAPGAKFSIFTAVCALCGPDDEVILPSPYWLSYPEIIKSAGAKTVTVKTFPENGYEPLIADIESAITPKTKLIIINSPSNPTGAVYSENILKSIAKLAVKNNFMILSDEIYEKLIYDQSCPHASIASIMPEVKEFVITVNGFSKSHSMTGWRLGYLCAPPWLTKRISSLQSHTTSNPTSFAQEGAVAALKGDQKCVEQMRTAFAERGELIYKLMSSISGIKPFKPKGAFYLFCDISSFGISSMDFCEKLLNEETTAVIPGTPFGADSHIRLSYACSPETIKKAADRISRFCAKLKK
jgi:aspartate aminotransferase